MNRLKFCSVLFIAFISLNVYSGEMTVAQNKNPEGVNNRNMSGINTTMVKYLSGRDTVSAYLAEPEGSGPFPALILIHEWWGLNDWVKKDADKFADSGYVAFAIDLYHGKTATSPEVARSLSAFIDKEQAAKDLRSAFDQLFNRKEVNQKSIGSIGWCMGGGYSLRAAVDLSGLSACVINYGSLITDISTLKKINCPILGIFGENDQNINPSVVKEFQDSLNQAGIENKIIIYPGAGHAFMNPNNSDRYNETAAEKAWNETFTFLNKNLKKNNSKDSKKGN